MATDSAANLLVLIGNLISAYKNQKINDVDLYNSIICLIYSVEAEDREKLKDIVAWLNKHEEQGTSWKEQYDIKNAESEVGSDYIEGLMRMARSD